MRVSNLQIESVRAQIGVRTTPARMNIRNNQARLNIRSTPARMSINRTPGQLIIDQTEAFASAGLRTPLAMISAAASDGRNAAMNYIGRVSSDGTYLGNIHTGSSVGQLARHNSTRNLSVNVGAMPSVPPTVRYTPSQLNVNWSPHNVEISYEIQGVEYEYIPASVEFYMIQYGEVKIKVEQKEYYSEAIDKMLERMSSVGRNVDGLY